ncbi:MAG: T9SS type A sorting domain-containing protein, partial [bacterium]
GWTDHPEPEEQFVLTAIVNEYSVYQVLPRYTTDFEAIVPVAPGERIEVPATFALENLHPNPFNPSTTVRFSLPRADWVNLSVFTPSGSRVAVLAEGQYIQGAHEVIWNAEDLASGIYLVKLATKQGTAIKKALLLR